MLKSELSKTVLAIAASVIVFGGTACNRPTQRPKANSTDQAKTDTTETTETATDELAKAPGEDASPAAQDTTAQPAATSNKVKLGDPSLTAGIPGEGNLTTEQTQAWLDDDANHVALEVELPPGLDAGASMIKGIQDNPLTRAKIELGRQLFFDGRLSVDGTISCASCHQPAHGYAADTQFGIGVDGKQGPVNTPVAYNRIFSDAQFWDGRAATLEEQAIGPIANPIEMGFTHEACVGSLKNIDGYRIQFEKIFPEEGVNIDNVAKAIASFERVIVTGASPFDYNERLRAYADYGDEEIAELKEEDPEGFARYEQIKADAAAHGMSESAKRGRELFFTQKANCSACHVGPNLADEKYHNLGIGMDAENPNLGRFGQTGEEKDKGAFKTPTIRNVADSPPYMHDGSLKTLEEVVEHYVKGGTPNQWLSKDIQKLKLSDQEKQDLVAFMKACSGPLPPVEEGRLPQ